MNIIEDLQNFVDSNLHLLTSPESCWQPADFLPDLEADGWCEELRSFRATAETLPDDVIAVLVGNMITEEALPNYTIALERVASDATGASDAPWARWLRGWTAEENRHGDLLNAYLRLTGRVDMRAIEVTIHNLIRNGFAPGHEDDPYGGLIYAAFQERATRVSHGNIARLARGRGEGNLARICRKIAADETRHEVFYTKVVAEIFERDPEGAVLSYRGILRRLVEMPGSRMSDGRDPNLFEKYAIEAQRTGVYTTRDYAAIIRHLNETWDLEHRPFSGKAAKAQDYLCRQPDRYLNLTPEIEARIAERPRAGFSWLLDRPA